MPVQLRNPQTGASRAAEGAELQQLLAAGWEPVELATQVVVERSDGTMSTVPVGNFFDFWRREGGNARILSTPEFRGRVEEHHRAWQQEILEEAGGTAFALRAADVAAFGIPSALTPERDMENIRRIWDANPIATGAGTVAGIAAPALVPLAGELALGARAGGAGALALRGASGVAGAADIAGQAVQRGLAGVLGRAGAPAVLQRSVPWLARLGTEEVAVSGALAGIDANSRDIPLTAEGILADAGWGVGAGIGFGAIGSAFRGVRNATRRVSHSAGSRLVGNAHLNRIMQERGMRGLTLEDARTFAEGGGFDPLDLNPGGVISHMAARVSDPSQLPFLRDPQRMGVARAMNMRGTAQGMAEELAGEADLVLSGMRRMRQQVDSPDWVGQGVENDAQRVEWAARDEVGARVRQRLEDVRRAGRLNAQGESALRELEALADDASNILQRTPRTERRLVRGEWVDEVVPGPVGRAHSRQRLEAAMRISDRAADLAGRLGRVDNLSGGEAGLRDAAEDLAGLDQHAAFGASDRAAARRQVRNADQDLIHNMRQLHARRQEPIPEVGEGVDELARASFSPERILRALRSDSAAEITQALFDLSRTVRSNADILARVGVDDAAEFAAMSARFETGARGARDFFEQQQRLALALRDEAQGSGALAFAHISGAGVGAAVGGAIGGLPGAAAGGLAGLLAGALFRPAQFHNSLTAARMAMGGTLTRIRSSGPSLTRAFKSSTVSASHAARYTPTVLGHEIRTQKDREEAYRAMRDELTQMMSTPDLAIRAIGSSAQDLEALDPALSTHFAFAVSQGMDYLFQALPMGMPDPANPSKDYLLPSDAEIDDFLGRAAALENPVGILYMLADGNLTPTSAEAVRAVYPGLFGEMASEVAHSLADAGGAPKSYQHRIALAAFFGMDTDPTLTPEFISAAQNMGAETAAQAQAIRQGQAAGPRRTSLRRSGSDNAMTTSDALQAP
jgi:hypothetical protein